MSDDPGAHPASAAESGSPAVPETIVCVDCGGDCHLLSHPPPDDPFGPGDVVAYRCVDCHDRWDLVVPDPDDERAW